MKKFSLLPLAAVLGVASINAQSVYYPIKYGTTPGTEFVCGGGAPLQSLNCYGVEFQNPDGTAAGTIWISDNWAPGANPASNWVEWPDGLTGAYSGEKIPWPKAMIGGTTCYEKQDFVAGNQRLPGACTLLGVYISAPTYTGTISLHMTYYWAPGGGGRGGGGSGWKRQITTGAVTLAPSAGLDACGASAGRWAVLHARC